MHIFIIYTIEKPIFVFLFKKSELNKFLKKLKFRIIWSTRKRNNITNIGHASNKQQQSLKT